MHALAEYLLIAVAPGRTWAIVLGVLAAILTIALLVASRTRWGENKSLTTCVVLAALAHVWLLMYAYGTRIVSPGVGPGRGVQTVYVEFVSPESEALEPEFPEPNLLPVPDTLASNEPLQAPPTLDLPLPSEAKSDAIEEHADDESRNDPTDPQRAELEASPSLTDSKTEPFTAPDLLVQTQPLEHADNASVAAPDEASISSDQHHSETDAELSSDKQVETEATNARTNAAAELPTPTVEPTTSSSKIPSDRKQRSADQQPIPDAYRNRFGNRLQLAAEHGGDADTEAAVESSLDWLVGAQGADGSWNALQHGAGRETKTLGENRYQAGAKADTGMTGLALLALLGAGHTHLDGKHSTTVLRGLSYLINEQMDSGDLAGRKQVGDEGGVHFARMYCHGMATLALAEAYGMTGDGRLKDSLDRAIGYTLRAQNTRTGGWRYRPGDDDPGDLSQFGWQAMSLHSFDLGGSRLPPTTHPRLHQFLDLVQSGKSGGLATYRPKMFRGQQPTPAMTAEALACRMMLGRPLNHEASREAKQLLLENLPGRSEINLYYWYYGTLGLFHFQDESWLTWNHAMKQQLLSSQLRDGEHQGSWDPTCVWGGYGGRVYSTSISCLCLEVYYRYLPTFRAASKVR